MIRVVIPFHLRTLSGVQNEITLDLAARNGQPITIKDVLDALEARYPMLRGTMRDHDTLKRRAFVRFFAGGKDLSLESPDTALPNAVIHGEEPFLVVGAIAGG